MRTPLLSLDRNVLVFPFGRSKTSFPQPTPYQSRFVPLLYPCVTTTGYQILELL